MAKLNIKILINAKVIHFFNLIKVLIFLIFNTNVLYLKVNYYDSENSHFTVLKNCKNIKNL